MNTTSIFATLAAMGLATLALPAFGGLGIGDSMMFDSIDYRAPQDPPGVRTATFAVG